MLHDVRRALAALGFTIMMLASVSAEAQQIDYRIATPDGQAIQRRIPEAAPAGAVPFARTELFFGTAKPDGVVTQKEFRRFVDERVTPRFPDGLTLLKGDGQFRGEDNVLVKEQSFVLILLYPYEGFTKSSERIDRIRALYKEQFNQQSVLRVDDPFIVWVSF